MRSFTKDFVAMALGMFFGALFAHKLGWFWPIGIAGGGAIGWIVRMLTEPKRIKIAAFKSYKATVNWRPSEDWKKYRVKITFFNTLGLGGPLGIIIGFLASGIYSIALVDSVAGIQSFKILTLLIYYISGVCSGVLLAGILMLLVYALPCNSRIQTLRDLKISIDTYHMSNLFVLHYKGVRYILFGISWFICQAPKTPSYFVWSVCKAWKNIKKIFWVLVLFVGRFLLFVHHERFTTCGVYAGIGALIIFFVLPNQILLISIASIFCAIAGALLRPSVLALLEKKAVQI